MSELSEAHQSIGKGAVHDQDGIALPWIVAVLLRDRRLVLTCAAIGGALSMTVAIMRPTLYTASFSFLASSGQDPTSSGLASLAGQFGIQVGRLGSESQSPQLYADLLQTREILSVVAHDTVEGPNHERVILSKFLGVKGPDSTVVAENAMRRLRAQVITSSVATRTTGVVTVRARTKSPQVSLQVATRLLEQLHRFNLATRRSQASEERRFTEARLDAAKTSLRSTEDVLQSFLQANRQYGNSPQLTFQRERLQREVDLQNQVVTGLAQQYEDARIREVRDTPVITVIERPSLPVLPDPGGRAMTFVLGAIVALFTGITLALAREGWRRRRREGGDDTSYAMLADEWQAFRAKSKGARQT